MKDLKEIAISKINDYMSYATNFDCGDQEKKQLYSACLGKIYLAFDLGLINRDERKELLIKASKIYA